MTITVRRLTTADAEAARRLGFEAFGTPRTPPTTGASVEQPGMTWFGAFEDGRLVARMVDRAYDSTFGGSVISTSGIAGVTVMAEERGRGLLSPLFAGTLESARDRGALVSTLFPSAPAIYRRFGYEVITHRTIVELPSHLLTAAGRLPKARTRRAGPDDFEAIRAVYDAWAIEQNGPLTRRGPSFPDSAADLFATFTGVTVALGEDDAICGYASWIRPPGYGENCVLQVDDLIARSAEGYRGLLAAVGSFSSVTPSTRIGTSGNDPLRLFLPGVAWRVVHSEPYMLRILDVPGALTARRYAPSLTVRLAFTVTDDFLNGDRHGYELEVSDGRAECRRAEVADRTLSARGLAVAYAGSHSSAELRAIGLLKGGEKSDDGAWDALFGGWPQHVRDAF